MDIESNNFRQIERLNQRGGRTLSIVDLVQTGTVGLEMAAYAMRAIAEGASILTGARPSGAGKTTLLAALLPLLPPDVPIVTVDRPGVIADALDRPDDPACYLVHEIGAGDWYGYLWGADVARYLSLSGRPRRIASCLHADSLEEMTAILTAPPLHVRREVLGRIGLILFIHLVSLPGGYPRRVAAFHEADGAGGHRTSFTWEAASDTFDWASEPRDPAGLAIYREFMEKLVRERESDLRAVRRKVIRFYVR